MKVIARVFLAASIATALSTSSVAQDDEARQATGLPMQAGENFNRADRMNISGRISLETKEKLARMPVISVNVSFSGIPADRAIVNDTGFYVIRNVRRENFTIVIEVDGVEVVRQTIAVSAIGNPRFDFTVPWPKAATAAPGVIFADQLYKRTDANEDLFKKATAAEKANKASVAVETFNVLLAADPKDFVAWTELGTVFFKNNSLDNAEACYFKAIEIKKDYFLALLNLGKLYLGRKQGDNAVLVLSNAVKTRPESADAHLFLAESYLLNKKGSSALHHFTEAIKLSPVEKAEAHLRLAALYDAAGAKNKASAEYKAFLEKQPGHPEKARFEKYIADNPVK